MTKKIPIGISDFKFLRNMGYEWIDKTLFIKEVIDSSPQIILLPRPRRFGKTLNLSMLRYFVSPQKVVANPFTHMHFSPLYNN